MEDKTSICIKLEDSRFLKSEFEEINTIDDSHNAEYQFIGNILNKVNDNSVSNTRKAGKRNCKGKTSKGQQYVSKKNKHTKTLIKKFECHRCEKICLNRKELIKHLKFHEKETEKCTKCDRAFASKSSLTYHMKSHAGIQYECDICNRKFNDKSNMNKHRNIHLGIQRYKCTLCPKAFSDPTGYKEHLKRHAGVRYKCEFCTKSYCTPLILKKHIQEIHLGIKTSFTCNHCSETFRTPLQLHEHRNREHLDVNYECDLCQKVFYSKESMKSHLITHPEMRLVCTTCRKKFTSESNYRKHISSHKDYIQCPQCPKQKKGHIALINHIRDMHRVHQCSQCGKTFASYNILINHRKVVHKKYVSKKASSKTKKEVETFECNYCERTYTSKRSIQTHIMACHIQTDPISCHLCMFTTFFPGSFSSHLRDHPFVKYVCNYCPHKDNSKKFNSPETFKHHLGIHFEIKGENNSNDWKNHVKKFIFKKKYKCNTCKTLLATKKSLKDHMESMHSRIKHSCHDCGQTFIRLEHLREHIKFNCVKAFECSGCLKSFKRLDLLRTHLRNTCLKSEKYLALRAAQASLQVGESRSSEAEVGVSTVVFKEEPKGLLH